jgi:hypothetical protein
MRESEYERNRQERMAGIPSATAELSQTARTSTSPQPQTTAMVDALVEIFSRIVSDFPDPLLHASVEKNVRDAQQDKAHWDATRFLGQVPTCANPSIPEKYED